MLEVVERALAVTQSSDKTMRPALAKSIALRLPLLVNEEQLKFILLKEPAFQFLVLETVSETATDFHLTGISRFCTRCNRNVTSKRSNVDYNARKCGVCGNHESLESSRSSLWPSPRLNMPS